MAERRAAAKGRRLGSSRRKQLREGSSEAPAAAPSPSEELPWASEIVQRVQDFFRERNKDQAGFVTRSDIQKLQEEDFPCSTEELELIFDGLDAAGTGRLSTEEFTAGLWQFLSSQKAARDHRRRKTASRRVRLVLPSPALEGADSEERRHFAAFMDQLGTDNVSEEQEIWQLWVKLRQDEPQLLGNLEDFLAKMRHRIQEAKSKKEALEVTLNKHVAEHDKEVQQLCEALEQQIHQEQERLEQESMARSHQHGVELQQALDASEREVQRLVTAQMELETRCRRLRSTQQAASTENQQLEESNRLLEDRLQHLHRQLQQTHERLQTARAAVAREHVEEPGDRAVAELPSEMPLSPQMSPEKSEKYRSDMRIRLGSQSGEPKAKSTHQVVWEMLPAEISLSGAPPRVSSTEEDPFPEFLKEERFSDQSSLLREMNDAIAALSKQLKPQAPAAPPALADAARQPQDDAEPQTGPEAVAAHDTTPEVLRETLHVGHELFEGDLKEGPAAAELRAPDVTQAGASTGAGHRRAQEPGAEQGESPEEAQRMLFLQGKGTGVKELMLKAAEHPQGAQGESMEAGEQALMEVEGEGWMQEKTGWEKAQLLGEAEEAALNQGENLEADLGPSEAGEAGLAAVWQLAADELGPAVASGEDAQPLGAGLGEEADPPSGLSEKLEIKPGEHLEPEPPSWGEAQMGAAQGDGVLPEVTVAPSPGMLEEERVGAEVQPWREALDADVLPAPAQHGGSSGAGAEEGEVEVTQPGEAEPQGESARGGTAWGGSVGAEVPLPAAVPPADVQEGGVGTDVQPLEAQSSDANVQLLAEVEAALQPPSEAGSLGTEQGGSVAPGVQPLEEDDKPESGLAGETGAAAVLGESPSPPETPAGSPDLCGPFPVKAQALELVGAEDSQADMQLHGGLSPETPQGGEGRTAVHLMEEVEDGEQGQGGLPREPVLHPQGVTIRQGEGAPEGVQPPEEAVILDMGKDQSTDANVQLLAEADELRLTPGGSREADLQPLSEAGSLGTEQGGSVTPDVQLLDQVDKLGLVEMEAEDSQADMQLHGVASPETPQGWGDHAVVHLVEKAEDGEQEQDEHGLPREPVLHPQGVTIRQGEGAPEGVQPPEEAVILDMGKDQSTDANVQLLAETDELRLTPGGSREADLQPPSETGSLDTEQGGSVTPDVQPLDQVDKPELVEMVETEDSWIDTQLHGGLSPETPQEGGDHAAVQLGEGAEDGGQGQGEHGLPHEPMLDPQGAGVGQGEGAGAGMQPREEAESLDMLEDQGTDTNVQPLAEADKLKLSLGGSTEADLQPLSEAGSLGTEQAGSVAPDVQLLDQVDKLGLVEMEAEDSQADMQLHGVASPETPQGWGDHAVIHLVEKAEDGEQGQDEHGLPHEPVLHPQGVTIRQGEGAPEGVQPPEEAVILDMGKDQSTDANVQLLAEADELRLTPGESREADLQLSRESSSPGTEQGESMAPDVQPLDQVDKQESVESEAEDAQADTQLHGGLSPEALRGGEGGAAPQLVEEAEDGGQGQGERGLPHEPVLDPQGAGVGQGEGAGTDVQPPEETVILSLLEEQSTDANVQLLTEAEELKPTSGGSAEADLAPLGAAGVQEGEQNQTPGSEAGLCAPHTADPWERAAGAHVSPPAEAASYPEHAAAAAEGPSLEAMLGAVTGPDGQSLEDTQVLELAQGERADAEGRPLDGAQGLEVVQGERLEAEARSLAETQGLGLKQGHDDDASALASPVSKVPLQISMLKLETMMQEDVLVPDMWRLGASGQAAQSKLQEQVSAQADKVRLHTASQQPEEKPPHVMETEQVAAGPAEPPKQEVPPVSTLHMRVQQEEDAGNDQLGMVLGHSLLGNAVNNSIEPQRQLLGEQSKDLHVGQQEKKQEAGRKTSQEGEPSPGKPEAVTADGAGGAPRDSPKASLDPDHLYNVLFIGDSHVGKTSFLYRLHTDTFNPHLTATVGLDYQVKNLVVDNKRFALRLWDSAGQERYHSITKQFFRKADGVVLMYDITSEYSFSDVRYWLSCIQEGAEDGVPILLLGNKTDCAAERQVPVKEGERLAKEHQLMFYECSAASGHNVSESMVGLVRLLKVHEDELKNKAEEVPKPPQKKKGCC